MVGLLSQVGGVATNIGVGGGRGAGSTFFLYRKYERGTIAEHNIKQNFYTEMEVTSLMLP